MIITCIVTWIIIYGLVEVGLKLIILQVKLQYDIIIFIYYGIGIIWILRIELILQCQVEFLHASIPLTCTLFKVC